MKRLTAVIMACMMFVMVGCGNTKIITTQRGDSTSTIEYDTYGLLNKENKKNPNIEYDVIIGNVIWGILLCETVIAPIYFFGFSLYEPVGVKGKVVKGQIK